MNRHIHLCVLLLHISSVHALLMMVRSAALAGRCEESLKSKSSSMPGCEPVRAAMLHHDRHGMLWRGRPGQQQ